MIDEENIFSKDELAYYNRQIILPEFGIEAQQKLRRAKVLVVGAGGLGSPLLLYLAAAGVGTIGIADFDVIDKSNMHRQVLFTVHDIGRLKAVIAQQKIGALNPHIHTKIHTEKLTAANAEGIIKDYDVVADGTDNFPARYLINDVCVLLGKPYAYAAIHQFEGHVSVFNYANNRGELGPNYRDIYPTPPPPEMAPNCVESGVLGVLPGIIGSMQALEIIKVITGIGDPLSGRLFIFDALSFQSDVFKIKRTADNTQNGAHSTIINETDYKEFCGVKPATNEMKEVTAQQLFEWRENGEDFQLIDVREPYEYKIVNIGGQLISIKNLMENIDKIEQTKKVVIHCKTGSRSIKAIEQLEKDFGFENLYNLRGGIINYINEIQPDLTKY